MKSSLLLQHPLHPSLVHFPIAFWLGSSASDLIALRTANPAWWTVSHYAVAAGVIMGAITLLAGVLELWLRKLPLEAWRWAGLHAGLMSTALLVFLVSLSWRGVSPPWQPTTRSSMAPNSRGAAGPPRASSVRAPRHARA